MHDFQRDRDAVNEHLPGICDVTRKALQELPRNIIYGFYSIDKELVYIGSSTQPYGLRILFHDKLFKTSEHGVCFIRVHCFDATLSNRELVAQETALIYKHKPAMNTQGVKNDLSGIAEVSRPVSSTELMPLYPTEHHSRLSEYILGAEMDQKIALQEEQDHYDQKLKEQQYEDLRTRSEKAVLELFQ